MNKASPPRPILKEALGAYFLALIAIFIATTLAALWSLLSSHLVTIAAACFIGIPYFILNRRAEDFQRYGIALDKIPGKQILFGLAISAIILPFFIAGNHLWETRFLERQPHFALDNFRQWPLDLDAPPLLEPSTAAVQIRTTHNQLHLSLFSEDGEQPLISLRGDRPFSLIASGDLLAEAKGGPPSTRWRLEPTTPNRSGRITLSAIDQPQGTSLPQRLFVDIEDPKTPLLLGARPQPTTRPLTLRRNFWWIVLWSMTHLILVALPEEYFYRGYLQTRLQDYFGANKEGQSPHFLGFSFANWSTSALFALGHVLIPIGGAFLISRAVVFFPSLIFGWMRERSDSIVAPVIFHASANMMVLLTTIHYF